MTKTIRKGGEYLLRDTPCEDVFTPEDFSDEQKQIAETTEQFVLNEILPHIDNINTFLRLGDLYRL